MAEQLVYFVESGVGGPIKIGIAADPAKRLRDLQVGNPEPLHLMGAFSGGRELELAIHRSLAACSLGGEWFQPSERLRSIFLRLCLETDQFSISQPASKTENAVSGENGGGGNRTRVTSHSETPLEQGEQQ